MKAVPHKRNIKSFYPWFFFARYFRSRTFLTAVLNSRRRQQYKSRLMAEFAKIRVNVKMLAEFWGKMLPPLEKWQMNHGM